MTKRRTIDETFVRAGRKPGVIVTVVSVIRPLRACCGDAFRERLARVFRVFYLVEMRRRPANGRTRASVRP